MNSALLKLNFLALKLKSILFTKMHFCTGILLILVVLSSFEAVLPHSDSEGSDADIGGEMTTGHKRKSDQIDSGPSSTGTAIVKLESVPLNVVKVEDPDRLALTLVPPTESNKRQRGKEASGSPADPHHSSPHSFIRALSFQPEQSSQPSAPAPASPLVVAKYGIKEENQFLVDAANDKDTCERANKHTKGMMLNTWQKMKEFSVDRLKRHRGKAELIMQLAKPAIAATPAGAFGSAIVGIIKGQIPKDETDRVTDIASKINKEIREQCEELKNYFTRAVDKYELIQSKFAYQQRVVSVLYAILPFYENALGNDTSMAALYLLSRQCTRRNVAYLALNDARFIVASKETDAMTKTYLLNNLYRNHEDLDELFQIAQWTKLHIEQLEKIALFCADLMGPDQIQTKIIEDVARETFENMKELLQNAIEIAWPKYHNHLIQKFVTETIRAGHTEIPTKDYQTVAEGIVEYIQDFEAGLNQYKYQVLITKNSEPCKQQYSFPEQYDQRLHKNVQMTMVLTNYRGTNIYLSRMAIRTKENPDYSPKAELFAKFKKGKSLTKFANLWDNFLEDAQSLLPRRHATGIVMIESGYFGNNKECPMHFATEPYGAATYGHYYHNDRNQGREHQFYFFYSSILYHHEILNWSGTKETIKVVLTRVAPNDAFTIILKSQNGSVSKMTHSRSLNSLVFTSYSQPSESGTAEKEEIPYKNKEEKKVFERNGIKLLFTIHWWGVEVAIYNPADGKYKQLHLFEKAFGDTIEMVISGHVRLDKVEHEKLEEDKGKGKDTQSSPHQPMEVDEKGTVHEQSPPAFPFGSVPSASAAGASSSGTKSKEKKEGEHN